MQTISSRHPLSHVSLFIYFYDTLFLFRLRIPPAYTVSEIRDDLKDALQYELNTNPLFENSVIVGHSIQSGIAFRVINHNYVHFASFLSSPPSCLMIIIVHAPSAGNL